MSGEGSHEKQSLKSDSQEAPVSITTLTEKEVKILHISLKILKLYQPMIGSVTFSSISSHSNFWRYYFHIKDEEFGAYLG